MAHAVEREPTIPRYTVERYLGLLHDGVLSPSDRVELLEGVIVAEPPSDPPHAAGVSLAASALTAAVGQRAAVRVQQPLLVGRLSLPEPDVAVVPGHLRDYSTHHPTSAILVIEVADSSLVQDRLTKAAIYAAGGIPEYWIACAPAPSRSFARPIPKRLATGRRSPPRQAHVWSSRRCPA